MKQFNFKIRQENKDLIFVYKFVLAIMAYIMYNSIVTNFGGLNFMNFNWLVLAAENVADTSSTEGNGSASASLIPTILLFVVTIGVFYLFIIRPQKKKEKEDKKMRENLQVGDEILTIGGIYGRVISLKEDSIVIESKSDHSKMTIARWAMQQNLTVHDDTPSK